MSRNWWALLSHHHAATFGTDLYKKMVADRSATQIKSVLNSGFKAVSTDPEKQVLITELNYKEIANNSAERIIAEIVPLREALTLVLAHAILENLINDLCSLVMGALSDNSIVKHYPDRKVSMKQASENPYQVMRDTIFKEMTRSWSIDDRIEFLVSQAKASHAANCKLICDVYRIDRSRIRDIDSRRQKILHQVEMDLKYDSTKDLGTIELSTRWLLHLVANCVCHKDVRLLHLFVSSNEGELRTGFGPEHNADPSPTTILPT